MPNKSKNKTEIEERLPGTDQAKEGLNPHIILGIDPGYDRCGIAILERDGSKNKLLHSSCVETDSKSPFEVRLAEVVDTIIATIKEYGPASLAIETLFFSSNQKTAMHVAETRGAILYATHHAGLSIHEYTPAAVKVAVTGYGASDKNAVMHMIPRLVTFSKKNQNNPKDSTLPKLRDDEFDAIAVAITHAAHHIGAERIRLYR